MNEVRLTGIPHQHTLKAPLSGAISVSPVTPYDLHVGGGDTLAADLIVWPLKTLDTPRVEIKVAVVALDNLSQFYV